MWKYFTSLACGVALGIVLDRIIQYIKNNQQLKYTKVLEDCFGEPMFTNTLSVSDVRDWSRAREDMLKTGHKIVVMRAIPDQLKELGKELNIGKGIDNYLIMAVVNEESKEIAESMLVKYERLDDGLNDQLNKGNGSMVIEG